MGNENRFDHRLTGINSVVVFSARLPVPPQLVIENTLATSRIKNLSDHVARSMVGRWI